MRKSAKAALSILEKQNTINRNQMAIEDLIGHKKEENINDKWQSSLNVSSPKKSKRIQPKGKKSKGRSYEKVSLTGEAQKDYLFRQKAMISLIISIFIFIGVKIYIGTDIYSSSHIAANILKIGIVYVESWNMFTNAYNAAINTLLWNDTSSIWGKNSSTMTYEYIQWNKDNIIANLSEARTWDLGNYSYQFNHLNLIDNGCGVLYSIENPDNCPKIYGGSLNTPMLTTYRTFVIFLEEIMVSWEVSRYSRKDTLDVINSSTVQSVWPFFQSLAYDFYFFLVQDSLIYVKGQSNENLLYAYTLRILIICFSIPWSISVFLLALLSMKRYVIEIKAFVTFFSEDIWIKSNLLVASIMEL